MRKEDKRVRERRNNEKIEGRKEIERKQECLEGETKNENGRIKEEGGRRK